MCTITVYRHDHREFEEGEKMESPGDHRDRLPPDHKDAEDAVRGAQREGELIRSRSLYTYDSLEMSEADCRLKAGRHLYQLEVGEADIIHRGDLMIFAEVIKAIRVEADTETSAKRYWIPVVGPGRYIEILVRKATVRRRLKHANEHRSPMQRATEKIRDSSENREFYETIFKETS